MTMNKNMAAMQMGAPLYQQVREQIAAALRETDGNPGFELSDSCISKRFGVSRITVRRAIDDLVEAGLLYRVQGRGTFPCKPKRAEKLTLTSFLDSWSHDGARPRILIDHLGPVEAGAEIAGKLQIGADSDVTYIRRHRFLDDMLVAIDHRYIPLSLSDGLTMQDINTSSLTDYLRNRAGVEIDIGEMEIEARCAGNDDQQELMIEAGQPVLVRSLTLNDRAGAPVLTGTSIYRADRIKYRVAVQG